MAGVKRNREGQKVTVPSESDSPYIPMFEGFRSDLDSHHDRREKVIKTSRDVTAQSKKIIFALQRARGLGQPIHASISKQTTPMLANINDLFQSVLPDLQGLDAYRYQRNITGGVQEYMEAVLFQHYLEKQQVMSLDEAARSLPADLMLTYEDYALGLFDMTGELMRFAITYMATNGELPGSKEKGAPNILTDMQAMRSWLETMEVGGSYALSKDFEQKMKTTKNSVEKVENSVYSMIVRGSERPKGWRPDVSAVDGPSEQTESY